MPKENRLVNNSTASKLILLKVAVMASLVLGFTHAAHAANTPSSFNYFRLPPIRLSFSTSGNVAYTYQYQNVLGGSSSSRQSLGLGVASRVGAKSYLWRPWFAQVNSGLGLILSNTRYTDSSGSSTDITVDGNISLALISASRFPFTAQLSRTKDWRKVGSDSLSVRNITTNLSLLQGFKASDKRTDGTLSYLRTWNDTSIARIDTQDKFSLNLKHRPGQFQKLAGLAYIARRYSPALNFRSFERVLISDHTLSTHKITGSTTLNLVYGAFSQLGNITDYESRQLFTTWNWYPLGSAWSISGNAKFRNLRRNQAGSTPATNMSLSTRYNISSNVRVSGGIAVSDSEGIQRVAANASLSANKAFSDITTLSGYTYKRYTSFNLSSQGGSSDANVSSSSQSIRVSVGHSLSKGTALFGGKLISNVNQTASSSVSTGSATPSQIPFTTGGTMNWSRLEKHSNSKTTLLLSANDYRSFGGNAYVQFYNFQAVRKQAMALHQSLSGNVSITSSRNKSEVSSSSDSHINISAIYGHSRLFKVKNLTLTSSLKYDHSGQPNQNSNVQSGDTFSWDSEFDYFIGELTLALDTHLVKVGNSNFFSLLFTAKRFF